MLDRFGMEPCSFSGIDRLRAKEPDSKGTRK